MIVYGIKTCDTCRKAVKSLEAAGHVVRFHDLRAVPLAPEDLAAFYAAFGEKLINRASTTWRGLPDAARALPPLQLLAEHPTLMKRPVIKGVIKGGVQSGGLTLGWDKAAQAAHLG